MMDNLAKITIIIPPHNRHVHLKRVLDYYSNLELEIIITDSSEHSYQENLTKNIRYYHYPAVSFTEKINNILEYVKTPFVMLLAEDDFYPIQSISECIQFLIKNQEYSSCQGNYYLYEQDKPESLRIMYYQSFNREITDNTSLKRIENLYSNYLQMFYSVHRTNQFKKGFKEIETLKITNMFAVEWHIAINSLIYGGHKVLNIAFGFRENILDSVGRNIKNFQYYTTNIEYSNEFHNLLSNIARRISSKENMQYSPIYDNLLLGVNEYVNQINTKPTFIGKVKRFFTKKQVGFELKRSNSNFKKDWANIKKYILKHPLH